MKMHCISREYFHSDSVDVNLDIEFFFKSSQPAINI